MCCDLTKPACLGCGWWQMREKMTNRSWVDLSWFPQHGHDLHLSSVHPAILWNLMKWQELFVTSSPNRKVHPADNLDSVGCCERQIGGTNFTWTMHATSQTCNAESINQSFIRERLIDGNLCNKLPTRNRLVSNLKSVSVPTGLGLKSLERIPCLIVDHVWSQAKQPNMTVFIGDAHPWWQHKRSAHATYFCKNQNTTLRFMFRWVHEVGLGNRVYTNKGILHKFQFHIHFQLLEWIRNYLDLQLAFVKHKDCLHTYISVVYGKAYN